MPAEVTVQNRPVKVEILGAPGRAGESAPAAARRVLGLPPETPDLVALQAVFGRNGVVFLEATEESAGNALVFDLVPGTIPPNNTFNDTLFIARMPSPKAPEQGVTILINEVMAEPIQLQTLDGEQIPDAAYAEGDYAFFVRPGEAHFAALAFFSGDLGGGAGGGAVVYLEATEASTETHLVLEPAAGQTVSGTGQGRLFLAELPFDRPPESGIIMTVVGVNDAEPFQFQTLAGAQIPEAGYAEGDFALFVRPEGTHFKALQFFSSSTPEAEDPTEAIRAARAADNAARAAARARRTAKAQAELVAALAYAGGLIGKVPFAGGVLQESAGSLAYGSGLVDTRPSTYAGDDLTLDFANGFYQVGSERTRALRALAGFSFTRAGAKGEYVPGTRAQYVQADVPAIVPGVGLWSRQSNTNLLLNSAALATQAVTLTAVPHTLSFVGTGSITLTGAHAAVLNGTGAKDRVSLTFTPAAGAVTFTVGGNVRLATLFTGTLPGPIVITAGATATAAGDTLRLNYSLDDEPWFVMVKADLRLAAISARLLVLNDGNSSNYLLLARTAGNVFDVRAAVGGALQAVGVPANPATNLTGTVVVGLRRDAAGKYSAAWKRTDGVIGIGAPGAAAAMPPGINRIDPGNFFGTDQPQSPVSLVRVIRADLTDAQITALLGAA